MGSRVTAHVSVVVGTSCDAWTALVCARGCSPTRGNCVSTAAAAHREMNRDETRLFDASRRVLCLYRSGRGLLTRFRRRGCCGLASTAGHHSLKGERAATQTYLPEGRRRGRTSGWIRVSHVTHSGATLNLRRHRVGFDPVLESPLPHVIRTSPACCEVHAGSRSLASTGGARPPWGPPRRRPGVGRQ